MMNDTTMMSAYYAVAESSFDPVLGFAFAQYLKEQSKQVR